VFRRKRAVIAEQERRRPPTTSQVWQGPSLEINTIGSLPTRLAIERQFAYRLPHGEHAFGIFGFAVPRIAVTTSEDRTRSANAMRGDTGQVAGPTLDDRAVIKAAKRATRHLILVLAPRLRKLVKPLNDLCDERGIASRYCQKISWSQQ